MNLLVKHVGITGHFTSKRTQR